MALNKMRQITYEDFVRAWQSAESPTEVAQKLGTGRSSVSDRAKLLRSKGVNLKSFTVIGYRELTPERVKELNALAESLKEE